MSRTNNCGGLSTVRVSFRNKERQDDTEKNTQPESSKRRVPSVGINRPPALYRLRVKAHTATPVWAFLFPALRARSAILGCFWARAPVHMSVWRPVSRAPPRRRATRRRARAPVVRRDLRRGNRPHGASRGIRGRDSAHSSLRRCTIPRHRGRRFAQLKLGRFSSSPVRESPSAMARDGAASRRAVRRVSSPDASGRPVRTVSPSQIAPSDGDARARRLVARRRGGALLTGLHTDLCTGARAKKPLKWRSARAELERKKPIRGSLCGLLP